MAPFRTIHARCGEVAPTGDDGGKPDAAQCNVPRVGLYRSAAFPTFSCVFLGFYAHRGNVENMVNVLHRSPDRLARGGISGVDTLATTTTARDTELPR